MLTQSCLRLLLKHMGVIESDMLRQPLIPTTEENKKLLFDAMKEFESKGY